MASSQLGAGPDANPFGEFISMDALFADVHEASFEGTSEQASTSEKGTHDAAPCEEASSSAASRSPSKPKRCSGCLCLSSSPSPLCASPTGMRDWEYPDMKGTWDKHCANLWRIRYQAECATLSAFDTWLGDPTNRKHFTTRLLAYYSLKLDPCFVQRLSSTHIEYRVHLVSQLDTWSRLGHMVGVPQSVPDTVYRIDAAEATLGCNPLIAGGRVIALSLAGSRTLGVVVPDSRGGGTWSSTTPSTRHASSPSPM